MTATEPRVFEPNAVFIPASAIPDNTHGHSCIDPKDCTLLYLDGDRLSGDVYTKEAWEQDGKPSYVLHDDNYYRVTDEGEEHLCRAGLSIKDQEPVEGDRIQLLPEMWCYRSDDTDYWDEDFRKKYKITRILGVYALNKRKAVHVCEITPSYECRFLGSIWEAEDGYDAEDENIAEKIDDEIRDGDRSTEDWSYRHCSDVDRLPAEGEGSVAYRITGLVSVTEEDALEEIQEFVACNCLESL